MVRRDDVGWDGMGRVEVIAALISRRRIAKQAAMEEMRDAVLQRLRNRGRALLVWTVLVIQYEGKGNAGLCRQIFEVCKVT